MTPNPQALDSRGTSALTRGAHLNIFVVLTALAGLAILAYLPALTQPLMEDDYPNILLAKAYGTWGWSQMLDDPIFRMRATTHVLLYGLNRAFDMDAAAYYAAMILLHVMNTWLVYALGSWRVIGYGISTWAAAFFAVYEGHQEAVMWVSGSTEPLLALFVLTSFLFWLRFLERRSAISRAGYNAGSLLAFCLALASKESAVVWVALLALPLAFERKRWREAIWLAPHAALATAAAISIFRTRANSFRFSDGSFSLHAPFWLTWPISFERLLWFWGWTSLIAIFIWKPPNAGRVVAAGLAWAGLALIPYSFLTYSHRIPSRQIYLASIGLAIVAGLALSTLIDRFWAARRGVVVAVCAAMLIHNVAYLWTKKRAQFLERAAPTEQLIAFARSTRSPIYVQCFPKARLTAEAAVELMVDGRSARDLVWTPEEARARHAVTFCYAPPRP